MNLILKYGGGFIYILQQWCEKLRGLQFLDHFLDQLVEISKWMTDYIFDWKESLTLSSILIKCMICPKEDTRSNLHFVK